MHTFTHGQSVSFRQYSGFVNFISEYYITLCIKEYCNPDEDGISCRRNTRQVNLLVFPNQWKDVYPNPITSSLQFSTDNAELVENLK
ncbi:hypothetical protein LIS021013_079 [Synechococcus phage S-RIM2]|uniref:Uncharacterized protein n=1 Tax=Synechococcus phage S-RIM2 TaxID=687800 RepID=A0A1D7RVQ1_9CAUD|nr:hypothetical protein LIS021013_079 [Synechococcus phage S-RIM2]AON99093.1 hypothetical protein LIS111010_078 [Synechococcus phage S-RIM2]AOO03158.1 hypothetical protein Np311112_078 [Synechococcus phage S-RIM2]AOO05511.1 hypothetical protein RW141112_078 [Synechococcus phage S-RIM2]